ncbi:hypothetical protein TW65_02091 [Stemphylium lycopersici]|nr:hypothetical protein TW65_02091 [Stemphylium lycopersici]
MTETANTLALASMKGFADSPEYSDLTITCGQDVYKVHKVVVCKRAGFFKGAVRFGGKEAAESVIDLPVDDPTMTKLLMQYLYSADYTLCPVGCHNTDGGCHSQTMSGTPKDILHYNQLPHTCTGSPCWTYSICAHHTCGDDCNDDCNDFTWDICVPEVYEDATHLSIHSKVYAIAKKYNVYGLCDLSRSKFMYACSVFWDHAEFAIAVDIAFSTTVEDNLGLRSIVGDIIVKYIELIRKPKIKALVKNYGSQALDIIEKKFDYLGF